MVQGNGHHKDMMMLEDEISSAEMQLESLAHVIQKVGAEVDNIYIWLLFQRNFLNFCSSYHHFCHV